MKYFLIALLPFLIVSCHKYEEGPAFSLRTKKSRIVGEWVLKSFNSATEIVQKTGLYTRYWSNCGEYHSDYDKIVTKKNIVWQVEIDYDMKEKYFGVVERFNYGQSYLQPDCVPVYSVDSMDFVDIKKWEFSSKKTEFRLSVGNTRTEYKIIRLTNSDLKLENDYGDILIFEKSK